jgi:hypothetical protein
LKKQDVNLSQRMVSRLQREIRKKLMVSKTLDKFWSCFKNQTHWIKERFHADMSLVKNSVGVGCMG